MYQVVAKEHLPTESRRLMRPHVAAFLLRLVSAYGRRQLMEASPPEITVGHIRQCNLNHLKEVRWCLGNRRETERGVHFSFIYSGEGGTITMVTMVTMGGDLQPGSLADRLRHY